MKTMLDYLRDRLVEGLTIKSVKEMHSKYVVVFEFEGDEARGDLPKTCAPGCQVEVCDYIIKTAMAGIWIDRGDLENAKKWLIKKSR